VSRLTREIVREVASLAGVGIREVTLIGQNVNAYAGSCSFADLVRRVAAVPGVLRIRFTTSHPMDLSADLFAALPRLPSSCRTSICPCQHGADSVLERMRASTPSPSTMSASPRCRSRWRSRSDIICGFPGETEDEHRQNLEFLRRTPYDNLFSFLYSPRPHTAAILKLREWGEVPRALGLRRLEEVQALQMERTLRRHRERTGSVVEVLVEEPGFGRSRENWTVQLRWRRRGRRPGVGARRQR